MAAIVSRAFRLSAGWVAAIGAAILLNVVLVGPRGGAEPGGTANGPLPLGATPVPVARGGGTSFVDAFDRIPPWIVRLPEGETRAGTLLRELRGVEPGQAGAFQAAVERARQEFRLDALSIGVMLDDGRAWYGASGLARDGQTPLDGDSPFAVGSVTKTFVAAIALQLVEERRLELDTPVVEILPEVAISPAITVRQLLTHTSGLADLLAPMRTELAADATRVWSPLEVLARVGKPWFEPGTSFAYSNTNYVLLGLIIERVTSRPFAEELSHRLLGPLRLASTGVLLSEGAPPLMRPAWASAFGTSGSMYSTAHELLVWADALYRGHVLRPDTRGGMLAFGDRAYGMGAQEIEVGTLAGFGHSGLLQGFTTLMVHLPGPGLTLVVMGTDAGFDPAKLLVAADEGKPSILELALDLRAH